MEASDTDSEEPLNILKFKSDHPGYKYIGLKKMKKIKVPIIYTNAFCDVEDLALGEGYNEIDGQTKALRETYALKALLLFLPFRVKDDLVDEEDGTYWTRYVEARKKNELFSKAVDILQNIQDRHNCSKMKSKEDWLEENTEVPEDDDDNESPQLDTDEPDLIPNDFTFLDSKKSKHCDQNQGTFMTIIGNKNSTVYNNLAESKVIQESIFIEHQDDEGNLENRTDLNINNEGKKPPSVSIHIDNLQCITATNEDTRQEKSNSDHCNENENMYTIASRQTLDKKQMSAYSIICSSFMIKYLIKNDSRFEETKICEAVFKMVSKNEDNIATISTAKEDILKLLKERGAREQLIMFLSGPAGAGKSHVINTCQYCCKVFCDYAEIPFDDDIFKITACTGVAATSLVSGKTIHSAAKLNTTSAVKFSPEWEFVNLLFIDEISFFSDYSLQKLDKNLRLLTGNRGDVYGGSNIIFVGDFSQLKTIGGDPVYQTRSALWYGSINAAVFLEESHRFKEDPDWGEILKRIAKGDADKQDFDKINSRVVDNENVKIPTEGDISYACPKNKLRNAIATKLFFDHIKTTHPKIDDPDREPPNNTVIIEARFYDKKKTHTPSFHQTIYNNVGDADMKNQRHNTLVDPALKLYHDIPIMLNKNIDVPNGLANGTLARFKGIKLKNDDRSKIIIKNWDGYKVRTVSVQDIEYIICEHKEGKKDKFGKILPPKKFKLSPEKEGVRVSMNMHGCIVKFPLKVEQFGILVNVGTTGHKLQGMSKDIIIVADWYYSVHNWVYVVLSRVRTLNGLYLLKPLDPDKYFKSDHRLDGEVSRLLEVEKSTLEHIILTVFENNASNSIANVISI